MLLLGITGAIGHGKSTLAEAFMRAEPSSQHLESFYLIAEVADALLERHKDVPAADDFDGLNRWLSKLPDILQAVTHVQPKPEAIILSRELVAGNKVEYEKLFTQLDILRKQPELLGQKITNENKPSFRPLLQWIGGYVTTHIDARAWYQELVRRAQAAGKQLVVIGGLRFPNDAAVIHEAGGRVIKIERPNAPKPDTADPTEREREAIQADCLVINDGSLEQLQTCASRIISDLTTGQLQPQYQTSLL